MFYARAMGDSRAVVDGENAVHMRRVLRVEAGQKYELSDGERLYLAEIESFGRDTVEFRILEQLPARREGARVILYAALVKFDRLEWMIEKATELGAQRLVPVVTARCEAGLEKAAAKRLGRWSRIAQESGQQCRRLRPMRVETPVELKGVLGANHPLRLILDEEGGTPLLTCLQSRASEIALLAGPEGGWTAAERTAARDAGWVPASLGEQILRAETTALAAVSQIQGWWWAEVPPKIRAAGNRP